VSKTRPRCLAFVGFILLRFLSAQFNDFFPMAMSSRRFLASHDFINKQIIGFEALSSASFDRLPRLGLVLDAVVIIEGNRPVTQ